MKLITHGFVIAHPDEIQKITNTDRVLGSQIIAPCEADKGDP